MIVTRPLQDFWPPRACNRSWLSTFENGSPRRLSMVDRLVVTCVTVVMKSGDAGLTALTWSSAAEISFEAFDRYVWNDSATFLPLSTSGMPAFFSLAVADFVE